MKTSNARTARFGPYALNLRTVELRKFESKIKMGEQSFRILCLLLDANGEMVTREELRDKLWASDTFVDFDHGLNSAVQRLRDCLSDSAENPRWIATVPRRGYRFVGRVDWQDDNKVAPVVSSQPQTSGTSRSAEPQTSVNEEAGDGSFWHRFVADLTNGNGAKSVLSAKGNGSQLPVPLATDSEGPLCATESGKTPAARVSGEVRPKPSWRGKVIISALSALILASLVWVAPNHLTPGSNKVIDSVAVLPFVNKTNDPNVEYLSDGITEGVINCLSQLPKLRVMARSTVFHYKGSDEDPQKIGRDLRVQGIVTGTFLERGDSVRVQAELVDVNNGSEIWGAQYDRKVSDMASLQQEIAGDISSKLQLRLTGEDRNRLNRRTTQNGEAYSQYLKGRYYWNKRTGDGFKRALEFFNQATDRDPTYALAYTGLADTYHLMSNYFILPPKEAKSRAKAAAERAVELDDTSTEAHTSLAASKENNWDWSGSESEYRRAIELNPNYATAHHWYSLRLAKEGRLDEALVEAKCALELDPLSLPINQNLGDVYGFLRQDDKAIDQFFKTIEIDPNFPSVHYSLGVQLLVDGRYEEGFAELKRGATALRDPVEIQATNAILGEFRRSGYREAIQASIRADINRSGQKNVSQSTIAARYATIGDKENAFHWLEKAYEMHDDYLPFVKVKRNFQSIRSDPRYVELLRRIGLPQ